MDVIELFMLLSACLCAIEGRQYFRKRTPTKSQKVPDLDNKIKETILEKKIPQIPKRSPLLIPEKKMSKIPMRPPLLVSRKCPPVNCPTVLIPDDCREETYYRHEGSRCKGCDKNFCADSTGTPPVASVNAGILPVASAGTNPVVPPLGISPTDLRPIEQGPVDIGQFNPLRSPVLNPRQDINFAQSFSNMASWDDRNLRQRLPWGLRRNSNLPSTEIPRSEFPIFGQMQRQSGVTGQRRLPVGWQDFQGQQRNEQFVSGQTNIADMNTFTGSGFPGRFEAGLDPAFLTNPVRPFPVRQDGFNTQISDQSSVGNSQLDPFAVDPLGSDPFLTDRRNIEQFQGVQFLDPTVPVPTLTDTVNNVRRSNGRSQWLRNTPTPRRIPGSDNSWATGF